MVLYLQDYLFVQVVYYMIDYDYCVEVPLSVGLARSGFPRAQPCWRWPGLRAVVAVAPREEGPLSTKWWVVRVCSRSVVRLPRSCVLCVLALRLVVSALSSVGIWDTSCLSSSKWMGTRTSTSS